MDLETLFIVYAAILLATAGALFITWRQNPTELGPRSWAIGSAWASIALVLFAATALDPALVWPDAGANLLAWLGMLFYARGTRQFVGLDPTPRWMLALFAVAAVTLFVLVATTPWAQSALIVVGSTVFAVYSFDLALAGLRRRETRSAPSWFIAFFFTIFGATHTIRGVMTALDYARPFYERPIDHALIFIGILGGAATAMGFSMLTTDRLLKERARNLRQLEGGVSHLRDKFVGLAAGDYAVRAALADASGPMKVLAQLFNDTVPRVEEAFREVDRQRSLLSATQESMIDGLLLVDADGRVRAANPAASELLGRSPGDLAGGPLTAVLSPDDRPFADGLLATVAREPVRERALTFLRPGGEGLTLSINVSAQRGADGSVEGAVLVLRDDRLLWEAQAQLQISDRLAAMGTIAAGVAHEINNPLAYVVSNVEFALEELGEAEGALAPEDRDEVLAALKAAREGSERVRQIVLDLKRLSRSEDESAGRVDVNRLVESAAAMLGNELRHHARLELELGAVPEVRATEAKLGQVFLNLVHNAAQAIPPGRAQDNRVRVRSFADGRGVVVEVTDTGAGIAPEQRARIFDAFYTTKPVGVGTGLGLAICHRVVSELGGRIEVESEVGTGSTFRVVLPAGDGPPRRTSAPPPRDGGDGAGARGRGDQN